MADQYFIHPSIGVTRVGNHPTEFFLAPNEIGELPLECDENGNETGANVTNFKAGDIPQIKRQGQKFRIYRYLDESQTGEELTLDHPDVESIEWTVHLANKKAVWYEFSELRGNLLLGPENSYKNQQIPERNSTETDRKKLIIDPGPRTISGKLGTCEIGRNNIPEGYPGNFPYPTPDDTYYGTPIEKLGDLKTDSKGHLVVLAGHGYSWGLTELSGYGGGDDWYDDISDGSVTCTITLSNGTSIDLKAWVIVGPPDFAPEIVNISSWDDTAFDVGVRYFNLVPDLYRENAWNPAYKPNYERDILPIINRIAGYHWVANVQSMIAFSSDLSGFSDLNPSAENLAKRQKYFNYFRKPEFPSPENRQYTLFSNNDPKGGIPLMPLNSGSNSVKNQNIEKFLALTQTQQFLLEQWSKGLLASEAETTPFPIKQQDRGSIGNVVGLPMCPGIEVTWTTQNPAIYQAPYHIKHREDFNNQTDGLTPMRDECEGGGCEPGDLTKRMAIPWQADFYNCTIQLINFTDPSTNKIPDPDNQENLIPKPPTYYTYWWPPQAPWNVLSGAVELEQQETTLYTEQAGLQVNYARGINSYFHMVNEGWSHLGFIRNQNNSSDKELFPYFVETERDYEMFNYQIASYKEITNNPYDQDGQFVIVSLQDPKIRKQIQQSRIKELFNKIEQVKKQGRKTLALARDYQKDKKEKSIENIEQTLDKAQQAINRFHEIKVNEKGLGVPRSGRRIRF